MDKFISVGGDDRINIFTKLGVALIIFAVILIMIWGISYNFKSTDEKDKPVFSWDKDWFRFYVIITPLLILFLIGDHIRQGL
jgi:hypothetical protein